MNPSTKDDISVGLLADGLAMVEKRKEKRLQKILANYRKAQDEARSNRVSMNHLLLFSCLGIVNLNSTVEHKRMGHSASPDSGSAEFDLKACLPSIQLQTSI